MISPRTKFQTPSSNDLLLIAIKPEATEHFRTACVLLFHDLQNVS
jgi:hypothetical protein